MADKYYRLVSFLVNICPQPLRQLFLKYVNADPSRPAACTTLSAYLVFQKPQMYMLKSRKKIRQDQWDLLYPPSGQADESTWDITLTIVLIEECFKLYLQKVEDDAIQDIRRTRNYLQHMAETSIDDADFDQMWTVLENATVDLAMQINPSPAYASTIKDYIDDAKINNMPKLGDTLRYWYERIILQLKSELEDVKHILIEISENTSKCNLNTTECWDILKQSSVSKVGPSGDKVKRMKTVDQILANMNHVFTTTVNSDLPSDFNRPVEVSDIKSKLRDTHNVVVTGYRGSRYLETALAAIKDMGYNHNRCVEMRDSSDWRHVDPEEVDLVLCKEPFGNYTYDDNKVKSIADIFNSMLRTVRPSDDSKRLDLVFVCELEILNQVTQIHEHNILQEVVQVYQPTSETEPADLTMSTKTNLDSLTQSPAQNMLDFTKIFVERIKDETLFPKEIIENAKSKLKFHKAIVITGPRKCGKTTLAISLASVYDPTQFIILNKPDDIKLVQLNSICLVLVEDFAGKYRYDEVKACAWLEEFEMLHSVVCAGKLNVIITCEENCLNTCKDKCGVLPILANTLKLESMERIVKQEQIDETGTTEIPTRTSRQNITLFNKVIKMESKHFDIPVSQVYMHLKGFCQHPDGSFLSLIQTAKDTDPAKIDVSDMFHIQRYSSKLKYRTHYDMYDLARDENMYDCDISDMCCTDTGDVVIFYGRHVRLYSISHRRCEFIKSEDVPEYIRGICTYKNKLYVTCKNMVHVMNAKLRFEKTVELYRCKAETPCDLVVCSTENMFYLDDSRHINIYDQKRMPVRYTETEGFESQYMCAASEDSVFVLGRQDKVHSRILQMNTEMEILSDILLEGIAYCGFWHRGLCEMVFDRANARLILPSHFGGNDVELIYLE